MFDILPNYIEVFFKVLGQGIGPTPGPFPDDSLSTGGPSVGLIVFFFIIILICAAAAGMYFYIQFLKKEDRDTKTKSGVLLEVRVPSTNEWEIGVAERMFSNLYGIGGLGKGLKKYITVNNCVSFEIVGLPGEIRFYVYTPKKFVDLVEKQILGAYQDADISVVEEYNIFAKDCKVAYTSLELTDAEYYPLKVAEDFKGDPLGNMLSVVSKMGENEGMMIQIVVAPAGSDWQKRGSKFVRSVEANNADPEKKKMKVSQEQLQSISKKTSKIGFYTSIRIVASAPEKEIAEMHVDNVVGAFEQFSNPGINDFKKKDASKHSQEEFMYNVLYRRMPLKVKSVLNIEELATIYHFPSKEITLPYINWLRSKVAPVANWVSQDVASKDTIWIGENVYRSNRRKICFERDDRRRHTYILGQTGSGKSRLMLRMVVQDIYNGEGVCFIDPHGETAKLILERIPPERAEDVIYFNLADYERPFGLNFLEYHNEQHKHVIVNSFIDMLVKMFDPHNQGYVGPAYQQAVRNAMLTAMSKEGSTLIEVVRMLTDEKWVMEEWLPHVKDDLVRRYWTDQVAKTDQKTKSESLGYFVSKFDKFVTNLAIRNVLGQSQSSFDARKVMDEGKILIVNLSKGAIGDENMKLMGLLLIQKILGAALSRDDIPESQRKDFFLYVDEFQNFTTDEFQTILSEARKYRLALTVGNQYITQMTDEIKNAVFGNVGTLLIGRTGSDDAKFLEQQFEPVFNAQDIVGQPNFNFYARLLCKGEYPAPFSMETATYPFNSKSNFQMAEYPKLVPIITNMSRMKYGRDAKLVADEISRRGNLKSEESSD
jgi:hypothetical protein